MRHGLPKLAAVVPGRKRTHRSERGTRTSDRRQLELGQVLSQFFHRIRLEILKQA